MAEPSPLTVAFAREHPDELAGHLAARDYDTLIRTLNGLPADAGAAVIARLPHPLAVKLLATQSDEAVSRWLAQATLDDALALLLHLDEDRRLGVLGALPIRHMRRTLERLVVYPQRTVGALVDPTAARLTETTPLQEAIELLRAGDYGHLDRVWIVDAEGRYRGLLGLSQALLARSGHRPVGELAVHLEPLRAETGLIAARDAQEWLEHPELPVVDHMGHLLGALSRARLAAALQAEHPQQHGILGSLAALTEQYFRVMRACLGDLLGMRNTP